MNIPWLIVLIVFLLVLIGILWGPTIYIFRKRSRKVISKLGACILTGELLLVAILVLGAEYIGLINPGGLILASIVLVSTVGGVLSNVFIPSHS